MARGRSDRSPRSLSSWSGCSRRASVPDVMRLRVVSLPAFWRRRKNRSICICVTVKLPGAPLMKMPGGRLTRRFPNMNV